MIKAVIFDMYETLVTHFDSPLYFGVQIAQDLGIPENIFQELWGHTDHDRTIGKITLEDALEDIMRKSECYSEELLDFVVQKRIDAKNECFEHLNKEIIPMLRILKEKQIKIGLISNCFSEEVSVIKNSILFSYFDVSCLSFEQGISKPDKEIYYRCMEKLHVNAEECLYVGDGGSQELETAEMLGMKAIQAVWYFKEGTQQPVGRKNNFLQAGSPLEIIDYLKTISSWTILEQISHETMVFMRGKYCLDEIGDGKGELKFKQGQKTIVTVYIHEDRFTFLIIFGKKERECFEMQKSEFSKYVCDHYDNSKVYHDGKWMYIDVNTLAQLEEVKKLIFIKKKPNRKPFPKENALYSKCGQRCDLCVHYIHTSDELRTTMEGSLSKMWGQTDWSMRCEGCYSDNCYCKDDLCNAKECASKKEVAECRECEEFPCIKATSADYRSMIHTEVHYADEITWGILPYVPMQYEDQ